MDETNTYLARAAVGILQPGVLCRREPHRPVAAALPPAPHHPPLQLVEQLHTQKRPSLSLVSACARGQWSCLGEASRLQHIKTAAHRQRGDTSYQSPSFSKHIEAPIHAQARFMATFFNESGSEARLAASDTTVIPQGSSSKGAAAAGDGRPPNLQMCKLNTRPRVLKRLAVQMRLLMMRVAA